jgi:hypothetical protein
LEALDNDNNQPAMGATKASINEAITQPQRWATMNNKSVQRMMMAATKLVRVARMMVTEMRVVGDEEGQGDKEDDGVDGKGGMRQRG